MLRNRGKVWRITVPVVWGTVLFVTALWANAIEPPDALAQAWPTPPPAPIGAFPRVIPGVEVVPVSAPAASGSIALQVDPIFAGPVPRIPPRPSTIVFTGEADPLDRVTMQIDAGAIEQTVQLTYQPLTFSEIPAAPPGNQIQRAFRIQLFDHKAVPASTSFRHPVQLIISPGPSQLAAAGHDPARLLLARFDPDTNRWQRLVTNFRSDDGSILVRILDPGLFALISLPSPVSR